MTVAEGPRTAGLVGRVQNILLKPAAEWDVIDTEPASIGSLFIGYACILAAIPAIATVLGSLLISHLAAIPAAVIAVIGYVGALVGVFILGFIVNALASSFGGQANQVQAMKLAVYASTAGWVAGVLNIIPVLGGIIVLVAGLYGLYLLYLGLPKLMKSPPDKTVGYFVVSLICAIVVNIIIGAVIGMVGAALIVGAAATTVGSLPT